MVSLATRRTDKIGRKWWRRKSQDQAPPPPPKVWVVISGVMAGAIKTEDLSVCPNEYPPV